MRLSLHRCASLSSMNSSVFMWYLVITSVVAARSTCSLTLRRLVRRGTGASPLARNLLKLRHRFGTRGSEIDMSRASGRAQTTAGKLAYIRTITRSVHALSHLSVCRRASAHATCGCHAHRGKHGQQPRGRTVARGILDSYRQSQAGQATMPPPDAGSVATAEQESLAAPQPPVMTFESVDEDACPAECITEIYSAQEFKQQCQVCAAWSSASAAAR